jgi:DNA polymerase-3 subunit alpha
MSFCPIHNHSEYSALDGLSTTKEIVARAQELDYAYIGLTDHGTVAGHLDFAKAAEAGGIKPIFGCELYHGLKPKSEVKGRERDQAHFIAGALTKEGLRNLWRLADAGATDEKHHHVPRINWDDLEKYSEGLFATSACIQGLVTQGLQQGTLEHLDRYLEIFKDDFYIELHCYPTEDQQQINQELAQIAEEKGIPMTIATDAHYASPDQYEIHDTYIASQTRQSVYLDPADRKMWHPKALYIKSVEEIKSDLWYLSESVVDQALQTNEDIGERSTAEIPEIRRHLPAFISKDCPWLDHEKSSAETLLDLVEEGIINRYGEDASPEIWERAERELEVFLRSGLEDYFLQTWDFCQYCDEEMIVRGPGRGSAPGAIVSYALGITDIDPIYYGLKFERFYNPGREKGLPDIDNDIPREMRKDIKQYLARRWGKDKVRSIGNVGRMKPLKACDTTWGACEIPFKDKEAFKKILEKIPDLNTHGPETIGWDKEIDPGKTIYVMDHVGPEIEAWIKQDSTGKREHWVQILRVVCSRVAQYGVHASGVVVSDVDLSGELPCRWATAPKIPVTSFPMTDVDSRQFLKQDLLGLRTLDTLQEWVERHGELEWSGLDRKEHPVEMWELLDNGFTAGIFQVEDGYARQLCKRIKPRSIADLGAIVAINRPGPRQAGTPEAFMDRREGIEEVSYDHPILEDILKPTYGLFLYQEQVIDFMSAIGYTPSDADAVRKILGKKKPEAMRDLGLGQGEWAGKGYMQMASRAGIEQETAEVIWDKLKGFADYSFNKSHAYAYAVLTLRTLYAKFHGTADYIIALLNTDPENAGRYVTEGKRMGVNVIAPDIDRSGVDVNVVDGDIIFGFSNIKGIGKDTARYITKLRKDYDITSPEKLHAVLEDKWAEWAEEKKGKSPRQKLRANLLPKMLDAGCWDTYEEGPSLPDRQMNEAELLGVVLSDDSSQIIDNNRDQIETCDHYEDVENLEEPRYRLPGVITGLKDLKTRAKGDEMGVVTIEFEGQEIEFVVFPKQWKAYKFLWKERTVGIFEINKTERGLNFYGGIKLS